MFFLTLYNLWCQFYHRVALYRYHSILQYFWKSNSPVSIKRTNSHYTASVFTCWQSQQYYCHLQSFKLFWTDLNVTYLHVRYVTLKTENFKFLHLFRTVQYDSTAIYHTTAISQNLETTCVDHESPVKAKAVLVLPVSFVLLTPKTKSFCISLTPRRVYHYELSLLPDQTQINHFKCYQTIYVYWELLSLSVSGVFIKREYGVGVDLKSTDFNGFFEANPPNWLRFLSRFKKPVPRTVENSISDGINGNSRTTDMH